MSTNRVQRIYQVRITIIKTERKVTLTPRHKFSKARLTTIKPSVLVYPRVNPCSADINSGSEKK